MADDDKLKLIQRALDLFPKIVKQKEIAYRERQKDVKRFSELSRQLYKMKAGFGTDRTTSVREHPRTVPVSDKNPDGITIVDRHNRRISGKALGIDELKAVLGSYDLKGIRFPAAGKLAYKRSDEFDRLIAIWTDYFNRQLGAGEPLDPDVLKALIASESSFEPDPKGNRVAAGISQITRETLKVLQDKDGESKEFIFRNIRWKDLKDPEVNIALAARWLHRKSQTAQAKLGRPPTPEELILEYKGLLKSKSQTRERALYKFRQDYSALKK